MKTNQLNQVLSVVRHTGDRVVVVDPQTDEVVVLMPFSEYESLLSESTSTMPYDPSGFEREESNRGILREENEPSLFEEMDQEISSKSAPATHKNNFSVPVQPDGLDFEDESWGHENSNFLAEESLKDVPEDEVEEKFYLEPIEP